MSIAFTKYVRIISGVGGGAGVRQRDLIGRIITSNALVSPDAVLEFTSAADVGTYFGTATEEYRRALDYFGYVSPAIAAPRVLSFSRWSEAGNGAAVVGGNDAKTLAALNAVAAGAFDITLNGVVSHVVAIDLSAAASLAAAAATVQAAVIAAGHAGATVTYAPNRFTVQLAAASLGAISITAVSVGVQDVAGIMQLTAPDAINVAGVGAQTAIDAFNKSAEISDNFGSFLFTDDLDLAETEAIAAANDALNVKFMFLQRVTAANVATWYAALLGYSGIGLTLMDDTLYPDEWPDQLPMAILGATDYNKRNAVQNYMFRQGQNLTPLVTTTADSDLYDGLRVNYYGQTATAGQKLSFYQRGKLMGLPTDPVDMNVYANEMWLKDFAGAQIMSLQLGVSRIPANDTGRSMILNILQPVIDRALFNGTISVGKLLTPVQKVFVSQQTGDDEAWREVENIGYVLSCVIEPFVLPDSSTEYKAVYQLIYAKDDAIRLVEGTHSLI